MDTQALPLPKMGSTILTEERRQYLEHRYYEEFRYVSAFHDEDFLKGFKRGFQHCIELLTGIDSEPEKYVSIWLAANV